MKAILVATDLSTRSDRAVRRAVRLAAQLDLPCHVVSVIDNDMPDDLLAGLRASVMLQVERFVESLRRPNQVIAAEVIIGDPDQAILERAEAIDAGLLVLGQHRVRPFLDLIRDSTMVRIVRQSLRPVLLVTNLVDHDYAKVLVPVSFSQSCAAALRMAKTIAPGAEMRSFHAVPIPFSGLTGDGPGSEMARSLCEQAAKERDTWVSTLDPDTCPPEIEIISGGISQTIARLTASVPDLIAVGAHTRGRFSPNVLGSFVTDLIHSPPCDLLVARA